MNSFGWADWEIELMSKISPERRAEILAALDYVPTQEEIDQANDGSDW